MAEEEKTEEATPKKIEKARKDGNVPKSQDASSIVTLVVGFAILLVIFAYFYDRVSNLYVYYHSFIGKELTKNTVYLITLATMREFLLMVIPVAVSIAIAGVVANVMQIGFLFTTKPLIPDLKKIDPIKGLKNLFSMKKLIESIKTTLKVAAVFAVAAYYLIAFTEELPHTVFFSIFDQLFWLKSKMMILGAVMIALLLVIGFIDLMFVRYNYFKDLKMTKQEVKDEYKQMEGDPQVKARIRRVQMEAARRRMMQDVPDADVVITNPTHYAVAIRYDQSKDAAPIVVAKGTDHLAMKIKEIALNHSIQVVENPPLARELYKLCENGDVIPEQLYKAVAEVLAFVYRNNKD